MRNLVLIGLAFGAAAAAQAAEPRKPEPLAELPTYLSYEDYPAEAIAKGEQGTTAFRLSVDAAGRVTDCAIAASSGSALLDATSCRIMRERTRFSPATDASGKPVPGTFESRISWRFPEDAPGDGPQVPSPVNTATSLWFSCIYGEAAKLVTSDLAASEVAERAYRGCLTLEQLIGAEMDKAKLPGLNAARTIPALKSDLMARLPDILAQARNGLKGEAITP